MQGSGTFGNESVIQTITPRKRPSNYLVLENGAYGVRLKKICDLLDIKCKLESFPEERTIDLEKVEKILKKDSSFTHVGVIHNETTSGVLNKVEAIGQLVKKYIPSKRVYLLISLILN